MQEGFNLARKRIKVATWHREMTYGVLTIVEASYKDESKAVTAKILKEGQLGNIAPYRGQVKVRCEGRIRGRQKQRFQVGRPRVYELM